VCSHINRSCNPRLVYLSLSPNASGWSSDQRTEQYHFLMWNNLKPLFVAGRCTAMGPVGLCLIVAALANAAHALPTTEELHLEGAPSQEEAECLQYLHQNMPEVSSSTCMQCCWVAVQTTRFRRPFTTFCAPG
jgi:hypothetical protein